MLCEWIRLKMAESCLISFPEKTVWNWEVAFPCWSWDLGNGQWGNKIQTFGSDRKYGKQTTTTTTKQKTDKKTGNSPNGSLSKVE